MTFLGQEKFEQRFPWPWGIFICGLNKIGDLRSTTLRWKYCKDPRPFLAKKKLSRGSPGPKAFSFLVWTAPDYASFARRLNLSLKSGPDFSFKILTSASRISCFQLSFDKLKSYHPHQPESHHSSLSNTSDWVNKAWLCLDLESIKVGKIKTVRLVRVTLIAGLLPRLTSVWIISSQIFHFLSVRLTGWSN